MAYRRLRPRKQKGKAMVQDSKPTGTDRARMRATPPALFSVFMVAGVLAHTLSPVPFLPAWGDLWLGVVFLVLAGGLMVWAVLTMRRHDTTIHPRGTTTAIVTDGPFRLTRNPLYLSLSLIYLGTACLLNSLWMALLVFVFMICLQLIVILAEERYLEAKFGDVYRAYRAQVRRWL
ncbi:methyltransferase family protein [Rhodospirillum rubrum]|uniref:Isoprenylcysteine carboxyl methyltransferase n=1 Tax=Rhodospirillum rubrum (strain ATCC 11170 / ATH 1.1.1 / DSM 467 / LMG 4362 / NCIMB 8255 / S1) TaxID=269796 RepID=Q2RQP7_RHORT|nr:isoprenylcysteine carboxylmethyltransferase family protein [Rhodospirillum rubrum]ABC23548.1 conserved hypothetical protein [Rhodospirillum rubrum ATCC 11170]MBK5955223.1 hypothetical protein [Rhodospirillum rubrum]QXG79515.1 isoprenylcysteine carboxylmethyltransferase family protein [Rhodospirillum rubrum]HAP99920.1 isoprenylcysteine carboxylmethyltransferase family protein [Rhodospirillum rubrum]